jgi:hypothetical protein
VSESSASGSLPQPQDYVFRFTAVAVHAPFHASMMLHVRLVAAKKEDTLPRPHSFYELFSALILWQIPYLRKETISLKKVFLKKFEKKC